MSKHWEAQSRASASKGASVHLYNRQFLLLTHIYNLKTENAAELIDGEMFRMEAPTWTHQDILSQLFEISLYIKKGKEMQGYACIFRGIY